MWPWKHMKLVCIYFFIVWITVNKQIWLLSMVLHYWRAASTASKTGQSLIHKSVGWNIFRLLMECSILLQIRLLQTENLYLCGSNCNRFSWSSPRFLLLKYHCFIEMKILLVSFISKEVYHDQLGSLLCCS